MHGLTAQEFADAGAQHRTSVAAPGIGCATSSLELNLQATFRLAQEDGPPITQLACPHTKLVAESDVLADIPTHNPSLWAMHERLVETELIHLGQALTSTRVRTEIARILNKGEPRRDDIAERLHMTDRTLQRRLQAESTTYQQLLDCGQLLQG